MHANEGLCSAKLAKPPYLLLLHSLRPDSICTCVPCNLAESTCTFPFSTAQRHREGWVCYCQTV